MIDTKDRILDSAEKVFAEHGYAAASLRSIIADAGVNLAAVHYHFGSKEELLKAVLRRRIDPVNRERLARLDEIESRAGDALVAVEDVMEAFLFPTLSIWESSAGPVFARVMGRLYAEDDLLPEIIRDQFGSMLARFGTALERALPELPKEELFLRLHFAIGAMSQALRCARGCAADGRATLDRLIRFLSAGFRAPVPGETR